MQVQTLLEILDLPWAHLFYYSEDMGAKLVCIPRDKEYFALLWQVGCWWWATLHAQDLLEEVACYEVLGWSGHGVSHVHEHVLC